MLVCVMIRDPDGNSTRYRFSQKSEAKVHEIARGESLQNEVLHTFNRSQGLGIRQLESVIVSPVPAVPIGGANHMRTIVFSKIVETLMT